MIFDRLENAERYFALNDKFREAFETAKRLFAADTGKYEIRGEDIYACLSEYMTEPQDSRKYENHRKYIDIQIMISGRELVGVAYSLNGSGYTHSSDIEFFADESGKSFVELKENSFMIIYPDEWHKPCVCREAAPEKVRKLVIKVRI